MEAERQKFEAVATKDARGNVTEGPSHAVGPLQKFEFGSPDDSITAVIKGGYTSSWNSDFLQKALGTSGTVARFYYDTRFAVDIGDPESKIARLKRKLLQRHAIGYLCIPIGFPQNMKNLSALYKTALDEYFEYEAQHPRPAILHEVAIVDKDGTMRNALVTAIQTKVGGGFTTSVEQQTKELRQAHKLSKKEVRRMKQRTRLHKALRRAAQKGEPFRNPFVTPTKRKYRVNYL